MLMPEAHADAIVQQSVLGSRRRSLVNAHTGPNAIGTAASAATHVKLLMRTD